MTFLLLYCFFFTFLIIKVFRFQRKTLLLLLCSFFPILLYYFFFLQILCTQDLENYSIDFYETCRSNRWRCEPYCKFFLLMTSLQVLRYSRFVDFQRGILSAVLLLNYSRYTLEIFSDGRRKIEIVHKGLKSFRSQKAPKLAWTQKLRLNKYHNFFWFSLFISFLNNILLKHIMLNFFIFIRPFIWYQDKGAGPSN